MCEAVSSFRISYSSLATTCAFSEQAIISDPLQAELDADTTDPPPEVHMEAAEMVESVIGQVQVVEPCFEHMVGYDKPHEARTILVGTKRFRFVPNRGAYEETGSLMPSPVIESPSFLVGLDDPIQYASLFIHV